MSRKPKIPPERCTLMEACMELGITPPTLYRAMAAGKIGRIKVGARTYIDRAELARYAAGRVRVIPAGEAA